jgi:Mrp family chromosome partitioning ATPase
MIREIGAIAMQNSLNQAFIRAYAKEKDASQIRVSAKETETAAADQRVQDELIMRIDTSSVEVPRPHFAKQSQQRQSIAAGSREPLRSSATQVYQRPVEQTPVVPSTVDEELRAQIALEMMRAGEFQSEQIASLNSFFSLPTAAKPMTASLDGDTRSGGEVETASPYVGRGPTPSPAFAQVAQPAKSGSIVRLDIPTDVGSTIVEDRIDQPVDLEAPKRETKRTINRAAELKRPIVITPAVKEPAKPEVDTNRHAAVVAETKQVENELRQAKVRVFNPVWEVDQLQWPEVCVRLMEARVDSLSHVTKHLIDACQEGLQVLAITSPQGGEGRTTVACCLAMLAGSRGLKVAIVDGDVENPTLSFQTNLEIEHDWQTALTSQMPLEEVSVHSIDDQITLVPLLAPLDQEELPLNDDRIAGMLGELAESFDLVIVDMGHMSSPNTLMQSMADRGVINAAIAVVDYRTSTAQRIEACIRRIRQAGVNSIGLVENFAA